MNLHEFQSKSILKKFGVVVPEGIPAQTIGEAGKAAEVIQNITGSDKWVIKAQVHAAGGGNYQTLINAALSEYIRRRREPLEETLRRVIREELPRTTSKTRHAAHHAGGV